MSQNAIIADTIDYMVASYKIRPSLDDLAMRAGYESTHFQKLFKSHVGLSPKQLIQYMHMRHARELLKAGYSTFDTTLEAGLSSQSRLHDLFLSVEGVSPGDIQTRGKNLDIVYGFAPSYLGEMMIGKTRNGICWLGFLVDEDRNIPLQAAKSHWPNARFTQDDQAIETEAQKIMAIWSGASNNKNTKLKLDLHGTNFQIQVWQALLKIPFGKTQTYGDIANLLGRPKSSRAVGNAVGSNPVSLLIPCHRVIRSTGIIDNYNWGSARKKLLLGVEGNIE